jgi:hypothetical protein
MGLRDAGYLRLTIASMVADCSIIRVTEVASGNSRLDGLVRVCPARAGMAAIDTLSGREFLGKPMTVKRYLHGSSFGRDGAPRTPDRGGATGTIRIELMDQ